MKMNWIAYGLVAAVCFGVSTLFLKLAQQKGNLTPYYLSFLFGFGIILVFSLLLIFNPQFEFDWKSNRWAIAGGAIWAVGTLAVAIAIVRKADIARLAPIYNINTLITVLLGIIILKEIPDASQMIRVIGGAVLIVIGAVLVSI